MEVCELFNQYMQQPNNALVRVIGIEGAKAYQMGVNSCVALFDANEDVMYIKTTDNAGFPNIRVFEFREIEDKAKECEYVTRREFEELKGLIVNGKQLVSKQEIE